VLQRDSYFKLRRVSRNWDVFCEAPCCSKGLDKGTGIACPDDDIESPFRSPAVYRRQDVNLTRLADIY